jgi:putative sporulation protein YtxC
MPQFAIACGFEETPVSSIAQTGVTLVLDNSPDANSCVVQADVDSMAESAARWIICHLEPRLICELTRHEFSCFTRPEVGTIGELASELLQQCDPDRSRRVQPLKTELVEFLLESQRLNLEGFMRFRAAPYRVVLINAVEQAVDQYLADLQYQEFVTLLRGFVAIQPSSADLLHVVFNHDGHFEVRDRSFNVLEFGSSEPGGLRSDAELPDALLTVLVTVAPKALVVHSHGIRETWVKTLENIFQDRVVTCTGCSQCNDPAAKST